MNSLYVKLATSAMLLCCMFSGKAAVYTFSPKTSDFNWTTISNWSPSYPGKTIKQGDTVVIQTLRECHLNASITIEGVLTNNGKILMKPSSITPGIVEGSDLTVAGTTGTLNNNGTIEVQAGGPDLRIRKYLNNNAGAIINIYGRFFVEDSTARFENVGTITTFTGSGIDFRGIVNNNSGGKINIGTTITPSSSSARITNHAGSQFNIQSQGNYNFSNGIFNNKGSITINSGGTLTTTASITNEAGATITNNGKLAVVAGGGILTNYGTVASTGTLTGSIKNYPGAAMKANGNPDISTGVLVNQGTISIGQSGSAALKINTLGIENGGILEVEIAGAGGPGVNTGHDQLASSKLTVSNVGNINVKLINGYIPAPNTSFVIATFQSITGAPNINLPPLPLGRTWTKNVGLQNITITAN